MLAPEGTEPVPVLLQAPPTALVVRSRHFIGPEPIIWWNEPDAMSRVSTKPLGASAAAARLQAVVPTVVHLVVTSAANTCCGRMGRPPMLNSPKTLLLL